MLLRAIMSLLLAVQVLVLLLDISGISAQGEDL
jgi:hypothetical protein